MNRVDIAVYLALRSGLDPGRVVRTLGGEYTGTWRDVDTILHDIELVVSLEDYQHIKQIVTKGCPSKLMLDEPGENKLKMIKRGNQKSVLDNPDLVNNIFNKEDRYSYLIPLLNWVCSLGPYLQHNSQGIIDLKRHMWDSSTNRTPHDLVLNDQTPTDDKDEVTFGTAKDDFKQQIYNLRASFPFAIILLALADIKACFRFLRIYPTLTGAFGVLISNIFCLAVAIVFGSNVFPCAGNSFTERLRICP
jgi:hypothetical protein